MHTWEGYKLELTVKKNITTSHIFNFYTPLQYTSHLYCTRFFSFVHLNKYVYQLALKKIKAFL